MKGRKPIESYKIRALAHSIFGMRIPTVSNSGLSIGPDILDDSHGRSMDSHETQHFIGRLKMVPSIISYVRCTDHGPCTDPMYISRPEYTRQSPDCPLVIFFFTALPSCITALHCTALPLLSIALLLILFLLLAAHACTLITSILQEYRLQTPCPCYKCNHCLQ